MKKYTVSHVLSLVVLSMIILKSAHAQNYIFEADQLKKGIYVSYEEFKFNSPSIDVDIDLVIHESVPFVPRYIPVLYELNNTHELRDSIGPIFGFCDGEAVYVLPYYLINSYNQNALLNLTQGKGYMGFIKVEFIGRYCFMDDFDVQSVAFPISMAKTSENQVGIIDFNTGNRLIVGNYNYRTILKEYAKMSRILYDDNFISQKIKKKLKYYSEHNSQEIYDYQNDLEYLRQAIIFADEDESVNEFITRIRTLRETSVFIEMELDTDEYRNGNLRHIGLKVKGPNDKESDDLYRIGTWLYLYKGGQVRRLIEYTTPEGKEIRNLSFYESGEQILPDDEEIYF